MGEMLTVELSFLANTEVRSFEGFPHRLMETDAYRDGVIPSGSILIANIWYVKSADFLLTVLVSDLKMMRQMMRDERYFHGPKDFLPDRFIPMVSAENFDAIQSMNVFNTHDPSSIVFGFGRRFVTIMTKPTNYLLNQLIEYAPVVSSSIRSCGLYFPAVWRYSTLYLLLIRSLEKR